MTNTEQAPQSWFYLHASRAAGVGSVALGALVLFGWVFGIPSFKSVFPGLVTMKVNTAVAFVLAGASLWNADPHDQSRRRRNTSLACATFVILIGLVTFAEYLGRIDVGIDQLLIREETLIEGDIPGRMAILTAVNFTLLGVTLLFLNHISKRLVPVVHALTLMIAIIAASGLVGYAYSIEELYRVRHGYSAMAVHTATCFLLLAFGVVNARPDYPFRRIMTSDSTEVVTTRHLLFAAIVFPFVTGLLVMRGYRSGLFSESIGLALLAVANMAGLGGLILRNTGLLYESDVLRKRAEDELRRHETQLEEVVANRTAELNKANETLELQARVDFLTGLLNRRSLMELAESELTRTVRYGGALSVLMLDIDYFKQVNDTHGHQGRDTLLKNLAGVFHKALREIDIIGRVGGEEFAIILPQTDGEKAFDVAERLRSVIADTVTPLENGATVKCTASIGMATLAACDTNIDKLLHRADQALYEAKAAGRNRVCVNKDIG